MFKLSLMLLVTSLGFAGCASAADSAGETAQAGGAPQQLEVGKLATASTDPRILNCQLEYEVFSPTFKSKTAGSFDTAFGQVQNQGAMALDSAYELVVSVNPNPSTNLSFIAQIFDRIRGTEVAYGVLPPPQVGGAFLFEIGASIPVVRDTDGTLYDHMRAYCSIRTP